MCMYLLDISNSTTIYHGKRNNETMQGVLSGKRYWAETKLCVNLTWET